MATPADLGFVGIGKEVTPGTFVPSTTFIAASKVKILHPIDYMKVVGFRGSMVDDYGLVQGFKWGGIELGGPLYADTIGWLVGGILGDLTTTSTTAPYSTAASLRNTVAQPTSHSVNDFEGPLNEGVSGVQWHELEIKWNADGLIEYDAKGTGLSVATVAKPVLSLSGIMPTPAWIGVLNIGGGIVSKSSSGSFKFTRKMEVLKLMNNTQVPTEVFLGNLTVDFKYKAIMDDATELARYTGNTQPSIDVTFTQGAGAALTSLQLHTSVAGLDKDPVILQELGKPVYIEMEGHGIGNVTDAGATGGVSPAKVTIQSAVPGNTWQ